MTTPYLTALESDLTRLFIQYRPSQVIQTWNTILADYRSALQETTPVPPTITMKNEIVEPVLGPVESNPKPTAVPFPDKEAQKAKMKAHKEAVQKKREELASQGVIPETQLTEENLKKWIQVENKNYWTIAEMTGCNDNDISNIAKSKNILSPVAMMIRKRKANL